MAFCKNCGIQLKDGELFCQTCGKKVEEGSTPNVNEQEPKSNDFVGNEMKSGSDKVLLLDKNKGVWKKLIGNKKIVKGLVSIAVVAVALLAGILIIKNMSKKVALDQCIKVETSGYDTQGCAVISLDEEALLESIADAKGEKLKKEGSKSREKQMEDWEFDEIKELIEVTADKETELSNGDEILVEISFDNDEAKEYGIKFVGDTYKYKVKGLDKLKSVDVFEDLEVTFEGIAPNVSIVYHYSGTLTNYNEFSVDKSNELNKGDVVTITFEGEEELVKLGYKPTTSSKEYTCENVDKYLEKTVELDEKALEEIKEDAQDCIEVYFAEQTDYIGYTNLNYVGNYVLVRKDYESRDVNKVYIVYSAEVSSKKTHERAIESQGIAEGDPYFKTQMVYFPVCFTDVTIKADGTIEYSKNNIYITGTTDLSCDGRNGVRGYTDGTKMYNDLVVAAKIEYNGDVSDGLSMFGTD